MIIAGDLGMSGRYIDTSENIDGLLQLTLDCHAYAFFGKA